MFVVILLCVVGAVVSASLKYNVDQKSHRYVMRYENAMEIAGKCEANDPALAANWREMADRHFDKHLEFKSQADKFNAYLALNIGAIVLCVVYLIYTGKF